MNRMRLIDSEMIKIPTSMIYNINGCIMIRVEDVQRIVSDQPTAFDKEKLIEKLNTRKEISDDKVTAYRKIGSYGNAEIQHRVSLAFQEAIKIVEEET